MQEMRELERSVESVELGVRNSRSVVCNLDSVSDGRTRTTDTVEHRGPFTCRPERIQQEFTDNTST